MLFPKNYNFGKLFQDISGGIVEVFDLFDDLTTKYKDLEWFSKKSEVIESQIDTIVHDVIYQLNTSFITPYDREDLHILAMKIDNIVDFIDEAFHMLSLYELNTKPQFLSEFAPIYKDLAKNLDELVKETFKTKRDMWKVNKLVIAIKVLENQADKVYLTSLKKILTNEKDPIEVIKLKDIVEKLENVADNFKFVAYALENMLIKMW